MNKFLLKAIITCVVITCIFLIFKIFGQENGTILLLSLIFTDTIYDEFVDKNK